MATQAPKQPEAAKPTEVSPATQAASSQPVVVEIPDEVVVAEASIAGQPIAAVSEQVVRGLQSSTSISPDTIPTQTDSQLAPKVGTSPAPAGGQTPEQRSLPSPGSTAYVQMMQDAQKTVASDLTVDDRKQG